MEKIPVPEVPGLEEAPKGLLPPFGRDPIQEGGPSGLLPDLGPGIMPETPRKSDTAPKAKDVLPKEKSILPEEKDLFPKDKDILPREKELLPSPKEPALKATEPDLVPEAPVPSRPESKTKAQAKRAAADGLASNRSTSAAAKPEAKSAAEPPPKPLQADWSTALHPESLSSGDLRTTSYVQSPAPAQQPPTLDGYCPVELCEHERWTPGNPRYKSVYDGRTFLFSGPAQQKRFLSAPGRYVPAYSGNDPVLAVEQKRELPGVTEHCAIYQGRLYMFSSPATLKTFRQKPGRYTEAAE
jgi:YHS domain-containing protein